MTAFSPNSAPLHDAWLNPDDRHDDGCDGRCYAGYCSERLAQLEAEAHDDHCDHYNGLNTWSITAKRGGFTRRTQLWLYPEIDGAASVYDLNDDDPVSGYLEWFVNYVRSNPDRIAKAQANQWTVSWFVVGNDGFASEAAPIAYTNAVSYHMRDVQTHYHEPHCVKCGELVNWHKLPVIDRRFPALTQALGWTHNPFQTVMPLGDILTSIIGTNWSLEGHR